MPLRSQSIFKFGRTGNNDDFVLMVDLANSGDAVAYHRDLSSKLGGVVKMLKIAPAAVAEILTRWIDPIATWLDDLFDLSKSGFSFDLGQYNAKRVAGGRQRDKYR